MAVARGLNSVGLALVLLAIFSLVADYSQWRRTNSQRSYGEQCIQNCKQY
jgi:hypothetical protein